MVIHHTIFHRTGGLTLHYKKVKASIENDYLFHNRINEKTTLLFAVNI